MTDSCLRVRDCAARCARRSLAALKLSEDRGSQFCASVLAPIPPLGCSAARGRGVDLVRVLRQPARRAEARRFDETAVLERAIESPTRGKRSGGVGLLGETDR